MPQLKSATFRKQITVQLERFEPVQVAVELTFDREPSESEEEFIADCQRIVFSTADDAAAEMIESGPVWKK